MTKTGDDAHASPPGSLFVIGFLNMNITRRAHRLSVFGSLSKAFPPLFFWKSNGSDPSDLMMSPLDAVRELERRRRDPALLRRVREYLKDDIPDYFRDGPISYLARHVASPNFETLRFKYLMEPLGMKTVVSQDTKDMFVPCNQVKKALGKLHICRGISQRGETLNEQFQNVSIIDFNSASGHPFNSITTHWGEKLIDFHSRLFSKFMHEKIENPDDALWIDRHHRGNLLEHYKDFLALFVTHGILFEDYVMEDKHEAQFVRKVLRPACHFIQRRFGLRPLIVPLVPKTFESDRFWLSYPEEVLDIVRENMGGK
ncbi:hypothetical protein A2678_02345 [Candidatus Kaiserbacteria bacterium RIFCSPHIGHO2_01_FULL_53_31]|uniref:Uncharacterized protein n=1 Tax=Candidatus Kaiserbacteria bacterium RIFCSPHIGHO2_01_FULL_53_31 TaxID=1798481 RepID=A0A1F6CIT1_9BACT|nr:MAG: hypothetical protein A2678_02345 [Candidatus Kaiserbacteria bacterium RIFCSPHIGHO2_01_FULL_53_31]